MKHQIIRKRHYIFLILFINIISYIELLLCRFFMILSLDKTYIVRLGFITRFGRSEQKQKQNVFCFCFCRKVRTRFSDTSTKQNSKMFCQQGLDERTKTLWKVLQNIFAFCFVTRFGRPKYTPTVFKNTNSGENAPNNKK